MSRLAPLVYASVLMLVSGVSWAGGESGLYIGGSVGSAAIDVNTTDTGGNPVKYTDDDSGYKVFIGYNFGLVPLVDLAIEGSYIDFGTAKGSVSGNNADTAVDGIDGFGLVGVKVGPIAFFGKLGVISWDSEATLSGSKTSDSGTDAAYGVGARFELLSVSVRAEYELFDVEGTDDIGFASVGVSYTF